MKHFALRMRHNHTMVNGLEVFKVVRTFGSLIACVCLSVCLSLTRANHIENIQNKSGSAANC